MDSLKDFDKKVIYINMSAAPQTQGLQSHRERSGGPQRVFVYGTLKKGYGNHETYLKDSKELGPARLEGLMFHLGQFPAINLSERFTTIHGEVYEVDWENLLDMDRLEGIPHFYDRIETPVAPHGVVWTYIFPHARAAKEQWVIPSGMWRGPDTFKAKWGGFGKGVEIGSFETRLSSDEIRVGPGAGDWVLRRDQADQSYKLINKKTREVLGSYRHLRDIVGSDGKTKPVLRLPSVARTSQSPEDAASGRPSSIAQVVSEKIRVLPPLSSATAVQQHPSLPIVWTPDEDGRAVTTAPLTPPETEEEEKSIPQAARLLGIKYGEA